MNSSSESSCQKFHLKKEERLPKCYKDTEKILKQIKTCKINPKAALANTRHRGNYLKKVYRLVMESLKHSDIIQKVIDKSELLQKERFLQKEIAIVLLYELLFGKGQLLGSSKPVAAIIRHQDVIMNIYKALDVDLSENNSVSSIPRYARIHTLLTSVSDAIKNLENIGFQLINYEQNISEEKYVELVKSLTKGHFLQDFHFKDILVFSAEENLVDLELYANSHIFLQDKSSYIPVHVLNPEPGSVVLDACAAPGIKAVHMASKMKNKGILFATELKKDRFETLKEMLSYGDVKIAKVFCSDFKSIDPTDQTYSNVEYILLDPTCSGSGMVNRLDFATDSDDSKTKCRLEKLSGFQIILLKHAFKFPSVKRIVYSTCSVSEEENEFVVHEALKSVCDSFKLVSALPECFSRGLENYEEGHLCLRTYPEKHLTNGFFVAVFERIFEENNFHSSNKKRKRKQ